MVVDNSYKRHDFERRSSVSNEPRRSTGSTATSSGKSNRFHDYDKPILLIGCSSTSSKKSELARLADDFLADNGFADAGVVVPYMGQLLLQDIASGKYSWPNIILVDLASLTEEDDRIKDAMKIIQSLYEEAGLLSIFINVENSLAPAMAHLEASVLIPYSDYELCIKDEGTATSNDNDDNWQHISWELTRLLARARLAPAIPGSKEPSTNTAHLTMGPNTFFLSLSFPEITQVEPYVEEMCLDVDAMEYRADLLQARGNRFELLYGMQLLRRYCRNHAIRVPALFFGSQVLEDVMPIVFTVRTAHQAGTFPDDDQGIANMFDLLRCGLRGGVEVLDVESAWDPVATCALLDTCQERYSSQILGSHHVVGQEVSSEQAVALFQQCALQGRAHGAKVVLSIKSPDKDRMAYEAAIMASSLAQQQGMPDIPNISLILGDVGQFSRIYNLPFTPVTHESLPFKAAPGQLTAKEIMSTRMLTKIVSRKTYCILGHNIAYSVSPQMQGAAFAAVRLPHHYSRVDVEDVMEFINSALFQSDSFGGASVTIPHKQAIMKHVDVMSDAAKTIGSVNTLIAKEVVDVESNVMKRVIFGDNTDWKGIFHPLERRLNEQGEDEGWALILGGGGTARAAAYAAAKLGLKRVYYNRTPAKAHDLAASFGGSVISSLDNDEDQDDCYDCLGALLKREQASVKDISVVISTLPSGVEFVLPEWLLSPTSTRLPVVLDVNYKPYHTKLLDQAEAAGCPVIRGSEMLWEQGVGQFELWTGRTAPYRVMKTVVLENCLPKEDQPS
jgi:pentafunctional AROM polypeptide